PAEPALPRHVHPVVDVVLLRHLPGEPHLVRGRAVARVERARDLGVADVRPPAVALHLGRDLDAAAVAPALDVHADGVEALGGVGEPGGRAAVHQLPPPDGAHPGLHRHLVLGRLLVERRRARAGRRGRRAVGQETHLDRLDAVAVPDGPGVLAVLRPAEPAVLGHPRAVPDVVVRGEHAAVVDPEGLEATVLPHAADVVDVALALQSLPAPALDVALHRKPVVGQDRVTGRGLALAERV